jgi:hypothetical protein
MALKTYSKFYYGLSFDESNNAIDFVEGATTYEAFITPGFYTIETLATEIARVLNTVGVYEYVVSVHRASRVITISANSVFKLLGDTGFNYLSSALPTLGFIPNTDYIGLSEYVSELGAGSEYVVQFPIQSYNDPEHYQMPIDSSVKRSTTGVIEVITFGSEKRMECEILLITDVPQPDGVIRNNPNGVQDCIDFLKYATKKAPIEFIPDEDRPNEFQIYILDQTESNPNGLGFRLIEEYDKGWPEYFRTGKLTWLLRET